MGGSARKFALSTACCQLLCSVVLSQVVVGPTPVSTISPAILSVVQAVANALANEDVTTAADAIAESGAKGNANNLAQIITASIEQADSSYAANHTTGPPYTLVLGAPYKPYNHSAAAFRGMTLGQAIAQAAVSANVQADAYAEAFTQSFLQQNGSFQGLYGGSTVATETLIAAQAANQSQAYDAMFAKAKAANVSVNDVATVLSTTGGGTPPVGGPAALVAANKAFGATAASLAKASGNATAIAALVYASMTLDVSHQDVVLGVLADNNGTLGLLQGGIAQDTNNSTAQSIQQAILAANLSSQVIAGALGMAIAQSMEDVEDDADPAIIIQAAILVNQTQAVSHAFNMAKAAGVSLTDACNSQLVAQALSTAAGQAAAQGLSSSYGPCVNL